MEKAKFDCKKVVHKQMNKLVLTGALLSAIVIQGTGCDDDTGQCCRTLDSSRVSLIPVSTQTSTSPTEFSTDIAINPQFDCEELLCVAFKDDPSNGNDAYCTRPCTGDGDCPDNFRCRAVLESSPGPDSELQPDCNSGPGLERVQLGLPCIDKVCVHEPQYSCEGERARF